MVQLEIAIMLPYFLLLENGSYSTGLDSSSQQLNPQDVDDSSDGAFPKRTQVSSIFRSDAASDNDIQRRKIREVEELLRQTNRLLRWYRVETRRAAVTELTRIQASPFYFRSKGEDVSELWLEAVTFEPSLLPLDNGPSIQNVTKAVKKGLAGRNDPEVSRLFLLDAEQALKDGRFREAVLLEHD